MALACSSQPPETGPGSAEDELISAPIPPANMLSCWLEPDGSGNDPFFQSHTVFCERKTPRDYPIQPTRFIVETRTASHRSASALIETEEGSPALITVGRIWNDDFPVVLSFRALLPDSRTATLPMGLKRTVDVATPATATKAAPLEFKIPFTLWPVEFKSANGERFFVDGSHRVATTPFKVGVNFNIPDEDPDWFEPRLFLSTSETTELALIAPADGRLPVTANGVEGVITGPGTYLVGEQGLTKEDSQAPTPPPDPIEPAPTCGVDGLAPCTGNVCAPSHRLEQNLCRACGNDGQTFCVNNGNKVCNPGHRYESNDQKCHVCGDDGQTFCVNNGNKVCNAGHRYESNDQTCHVCGDDGQTYCYVNGSKACNPGHRYESNDQTCHVCGDDGQTYCYVNGSKVCNPGHRYESNDQTCHVCGGEGQTYCLNNGSKVCEPGLRYDSNSLTCRR